MGRPGQVTKHQCMESSESEAEEEAPAGHQQPMARYLTELVVHSEPADVGDTEEEMGAFEVQDVTEIPVPPSTRNVMEGTEAISMQECVVREAWHRWWESLWQVAVAALQDRSNREPTVHVKKLMQEEVEKFEIWRMCFLEEGDSFEENGMVS